MHLIRPLRILPALLGQEIPFTAFLLGPDQPHSPSWWQPPLVPHDESRSHDILLLVFG